MVSLIIIIIIIIVIQYNNNGNVVMVSKYGEACLHCMALLSIQLNYVMVSRPFFFCLVCGLLDDNNNNND